MQFNPEVSLLACRYRNDTKMTKMTKLELDALNYMRTKISIYYKTLIDLIL